MILYLWMMVQIICESLPISSSGHVALLQFLLYGSQHIYDADLQAFDYCLQGISAIIFFIYFFSSWWKLIIAQPIAISFLLDRKIWHHKILPALLFVMIADGITFLCWYADLAQKIDISLYTGFLITAGVLWSMQYAQERKNVDLWSLKHSLIVGFVQGCALLPGVSRFACTMASLQWLGYSRFRAFSISFLIEWPLILAASVKGFISLHDAWILHMMTTELFIYAVGCSSMIAYLCLYGVERIIDKNCLWKFSYYMIIPTTIAFFIPRTI